MVPLPDRLATSRARLQWFARILPVEVPPPRWVVQDLWLAMGLDAETFARCYPLRPPEPTEALPRRPV